jgi:hypothetical protein
MNQDAIVAFKKIILIFYIISDKKTYKFKFSFSTI